MTEDARHQISDTPIDPSAPGTYRWYILTLGALTFTIAIAIPNMAMPVLFDEISKELNLDLVQVGWIWGISALTGMLIGLVGGSMGDRFGTKRILTIGCMLGGVFGALRGLSPDYITLIITSFIFGLMPAAIPMNIHKVIGIWFSGKSLGLANGIACAGMALGFMLGSSLSATLLSPWLGGWRPVLYLYGGLSFIVGILWMFSRATPASHTSQTNHADTVPLRDGVPYVVRVRNVWMVCMAMFGMNGCIQGMLGYLPLFLRHTGWPDKAADSALATFHGVSLMAAVPIALLSDRMGSRRKPLLAAALITVTGVGVLSLSSEAAVWSGVAIAGLVRDGFMAILMTMVIEIRAIGTKYAGTAIGMVLVFARLGNLLSPPVGNSLATYSPAFPFLFWSFLGWIGFIGFYLFKEGE